jgi:uncharacterized phage-like protein YoqJ
MEIMVVPLQVPSRVSTEKIYFLKKLIRGHIIILWNKEFQWVVVGGATKG